MRCLVGYIDAARRHGPELGGRILMACVGFPWDALPAALWHFACRCGLELDFGTMRRFKYPAMRLALLPGLVSPPGSRRTSL